VSDGDPERTKISHNAEIPPIYDGQAVAQENYYDDDVADEITVEELRTLRRVSDHIPIKAYTIALVELTERLSYYGAVQVFVNFIQQPNPGTATGKALDPNAKNAKPGALGLGQQASTGLTTFNQVCECPNPAFLSIS
jgi:POT family proton-dependent oligopeptide transporter